MSLLPVHKTLIVAALCMSLVLFLWGVVHGIGRHEDAGWIALGLGGVSLPLGSLYLRKLYRNPPIR